MNALGEKAEAAIMKTYELWLRTGHSAHVEDTGGGMHVAIWSQSIKSQEK